MKGWEGGGKDRIHMNEIIFTSPDSFLLTQFEMKRDGRRESQNNVY